MLHLEGSHSYDDWPLVQHIEHGFQLNHLKALRLSKWVIGGPRMLMLISAPRLESLWLQWTLNKYECHQLDSPQMAGITGLGKFPELRYLTLKGPDIRFTTRFAQVFPSITHLHLSSADPSNGIVIQRALVDHWTSLHTLVLTVLTEPE